MATCRKFLNVTKINKRFLYTCQKVYSTTAEIRSDSGTNKDVVIPYRIHRGPTDILKALASTIKKDYTASKYKYEDDPYFIPASSITKRAFALSKESGKKAARYFLEKYPELFLCHKSVPHIKAFDPPTVYTQENVTSPDVLTECIRNFEVNNSITVYKILKEKGIAVNQEIKQDLLELLCFYNGIQPLDEDYYEERYFQRIVHGDKWNLKGEAERLFDEMEKDSKAYSALIAGAGKFQHSERAFQLYDEMKSKGLIPTVQAYNSLIPLVPTMKEDKESSCEYALILLGCMQKEGLMPDIYTMNAILEVFLRRKYRKVGEMTLSLLGEMRQLNIEPSLGTYTTLLNIFCNEQQCKLGALYEIISYLEEKELTAKHPSDVLFFFTAMEKCYKFAQDKDLAYRINNIVEYKNNCKLLGNSLSESLYFKHFLRVLLEVEDFEKFMEVYIRYVPNTYTPEPMLMNDVLQSLQFGGHYKYLPKLCNDVFIFEQTERENILNVIMEAAGTIKHDKKVQEELVKIIWKIVDRINSRLESKRFNFLWSGSVLGNVLSTFINGKDLEKSWSVMEQLSRNESSIIGLPSKDCLLKFCELFLENQEYEKVKFCIKYAKREGFPEIVNNFKVLSDAMFEKEQLEGKHRVHVNAILNSFSYDNTLKESSGESLSNSSSSKSSSDSSSSDSSSSDSSSSDEDEK